MDYATLWRTSQDVVTTCMRDAGFEYTPQDTSPSLSIDEAGCQGKAQREVYETGTFAAFSDPAFASLQDEISQVYDNVPTGSRLTELEAAWSSCMSDAGYFATAPDAPNSISDTFNELSSVSVTDPSTGPTPDTTVIADPRAVEIATAVADVRCKESVDDDAKYRKVQLALAQEFVDSHKTELDAWVAAFSQDAQ